MVIFSEFKPPKLHWWERIGARLFGQRFEERDGETVIIGYRWRGRVYVLDQANVKW